MMESIEESWEILTLKLKFGIVHAYVQGLGNVKITLMSL